MLLVKDLGQPRDQLLIKGSERRSWMTPSKFWVLGARCLYRNSTISTSYTNQLIIRTSWMQFIDLANKNKGCPAKSQFQINNTSTFFNGSISLFFCLFFSCKIFTLQCCAGFCHTTTWVNLKYTYGPFLWSLPPLLSLSHPPLAFLIVQDWEIFGHQESSVTLLSSRWWRGLGSLKPLIWGQGRE